MSGVKYEGTVKAMTLFVVIIVCLSIIGCGDKSLKYYNRGLVYANKQQYDQAITVYTKAIEIKPGLDKAYAMRGLAYFVKGEFDQAIWNFYEILEINPGNAEAYNCMGIVYYFKKEYDKAWENVHKAQTLGSRAYPTFLKDLREASGREKYNYKSY
jgi:tetratricopeptide (TPR) repeat protein